MSEQSEALKERTMSFAINVLKLIDKFPRTLARELSSSPGSASLSRKPRRVSTGS